jgi:hypothetical protein
MANGQTGITRGPLHLPDCYGRPTCDPAPVCPACGNLECLCRPRFFAGQLLSEEDLNRLDYYVRAKNRLHNRHLHGWGVSCGLEVICGVCEPDGGQVIVKPGYALSPCGNDIVVCKPERVDICDLIARCRPPGEDCFDLVVPPPPDSTGVPGRGSGVPLPDCGAEQEWVLAICYTEKPSRAIAALRANVCDCGCGCGGGSTGHGGGGCGCGNGGGHQGGHSQHGSSGGCGCKSGSNATHGTKPRARKTPRNVPEQCEPTVTCESYRFVVYKAPKKSEDGQLGAAARRFLCCLEPFLREVDTIPSDLTPAQAQQWVVGFRDVLREFLVHEGLWDCELASRLAAIAIPKVNGQTPDTALGQLNETTVALASLAAFIFQKCFCAALLPPCPDPSQTDCVPLATITVATNPCRVLRICNISARKFLVTIPNIAYWWSFVEGLSPDGSSLGSWLRNVLEKMCCRPIGDFSENIQGAEFFGGRPEPEAATRGRRRRGSETATPPPAPPPASGRTKFASLLWSDVLQPDRVVGPEHIMLGLLGARTAQGKPFLTDQELASPSGLLVANRIVAPMLRTLVPADAFAPLTGEAGAGGTGKVDDLAREIGELRSKIEKQQQRITELERRG